MKRFHLLFMTLIAAGLAACSPQTLAPPLHAPLSQTTVDETAIKTALLGFDGLLSAVDIAVATGAIKPGSPEALTLRRALKTALDGLNLAATAQRAGNAPDALVALERAKGAFLEIRTILTPRGER